MTIIPYKEYKEVEEKIRVNNSFTYYPEIPEGFCIITDTREQTPYKFNDLGIENIVKKLDYGDYSILGMEDIVAIERKSQEDFYKSIGKDRERFKKRIIELSKLSWAGLVIEATEDDLLCPSMSWSNISPNSIYGSMVAFAAKYNIHIYCGSREYCRMRLVNWLIKFYENCREMK
jgi:DNA excision repair protein ERCC-4